MVDVFVAYVTAVEGVVRTAVVEHHAYGVSGLVVDDVALCIACDGGGVLDGETGLAVGILKCGGSGVGVTLRVGVLVLVFVREVAVVVVVVGVHTLIAETVDGSEAVAHFDAAHDALVLVVEVGVHRFKHVGVHFGEGVDVLCDVGTEHHAELTVLEDRLGVDVEFPSFVLHLSDVAVAEGGESGA